MNSETTTAKRNTASIIAKCLIVFLVLAIICSLSIWAWFTSNQEAKASGISVKAKASGVQVSWDGVNYYDDLTALSKDDENYAEGKNGVAKYLTGNANDPYYLKLITGNGVDFFEPYLNRRTGKAYVSDDVWQGVTVDKNNSSGRYIDVDLYFRGTSGGNVWLHDDSTVTPLSTDYGVRTTDSGEQSTNSGVRTSDFGAFTRDYIAAASRVAFLNVNETTENGVTTETGEECKFIWAPNANIHLKGSDGYTVYTETTTADVSTTTGITIDGGVEDNNKTYYLWTFWDDSVVEDYQQDLNKFEPRKFLYNNKYRYFTTTVTTYLPKYGGDNPSIPFFVNESESKPTESSVKQYNIYVDGEASAATLRKDLGQYYVVTDTEFTVGDAAFSNAMKIVDGNIAVGSKITYEVGYDPVNKLLVILNYQVEGGGSFDLSKGSTTTVTKVPYYPLPDNTNCALVNSSNSLALSTSQHHMKSVQFKDSEKVTVVPEYISPEEQFTAERNTEGKEPYEYTYKFKNKKTGTYVAIDSATGSVSVDSTAENAAEFTLEYKESVTGPLLKTADGYYLVFQNSTIKAVTEADLDSKAIFTVYTGDAFEVITNYDVSTEKYYYYKAGDTALTQLTSVTDEYPLYSSPKPASDTTDTIGVQIAKLTKNNEDDEYYTAKIRMRIWVEGTDQDAQYPLANGRFNLNLHFTNTPTEEASE